MLKDAHDIFIDERDQIWCVERETHCVHKFTGDSGRQPDTKQTKADSTRSAATSG